MCLTFKFKKAFGNQKFFLKNIESTLFFFHHSVLFWAEGKLCFTLLSGFINSDMLLMTGNMLLVWWVLFQIVLNELICAGMEITSWIYRLCMSTGDCSSWWRLCDGMRNLHLEWYLGPLICLITTLTGDTYISILSDQLLQFMSIVHFSGLGKFQQDSATSHTWRIVTEWFQKHFSDFKHFSWLPEFWDMNIIEHI